MVKMLRQVQEHGKRFSCGERIPESGIYRVLHRNHRLPHEVTLLRDQLFPKCMKCDDSVEFELMRSASSVAVSGFKVALYSLPVADEEEFTAVP